MDQVSSDLFVDDLDFRRLKGALYLFRLTIPSGLLRFDHGLGDVICVLRPDDRLLSFQNALDEVAQAVRPGPIGICIIYYVVTVPSGSEKIWPGSKIMGTGAVLSC